MSIHAIGIYNMGLSAREATTSGRGEFLKLLIVIYN
jgi:hypothetical protein